MREPPPCGTYAAYQRHFRRGEPVDEACREACRLYAADYRAGNPAAIEAARVYGRLLSAAKTQLTREYPARFNEIFEALKAIEATAGTTTSHQQTGGPPP